MDADRLQQLELQLNRLQRVTAMLAAGFLVLLAWRLLPGPPVIEARELRMRDSRGVVRGALAMLDEDRPSIRLNDENGRACALLYLNREHGGAFRMSDPTGVHRLSLTVAEDGRPEVFLTDPESRSWTRLTLPDASRPGLALGDRYGTIWSAPLRAEAPGTPLR